MPKGCFWKGLVQDPQTETLCPLNIMSVTYSLSTLGTVVLPRRTPSRCSSCIWAVRLVPVVDQVVFNPCRLVVPCKSLGSSPKPVSEVCWLCDLGHVHVV